MYSIINTNTLECVYCVLEFAHFMFSVYIVKNYYCANYETREPVDAVCVKYGINLISRNIYLGN